MTTYQSQAVTTKDRDGNELTFKTLNIDGEEAVLAAAVDVELPDGQQVTVNVLFEEADVCGLIGYLHDNFGRGVKPAPLSLPWEDPRADPRADMLAMKEQYAATYGVPVDAVVAQPLGGFPSTPEDLQYYAEQDAQTWQPKPGDTVHVVTATVNDHQTGTVLPLEPEGRPCPVIYSGVQCTATDGHDFGHQIPGYTELLPQNDAGTATPPADAQGAVNTPQPVAPGQSAAESATGAGTPEAAPASQPAAEAEKPKRKRRTKLEIAYDDALEAHNQAPTDDTWAALGAARAALQAKDPGNQRLAEGIAALQNPSAQPTPDEAQQVGFAPGPLSAGALPVPGQVYSPDENGGIPAQAFSFAPGQTPQLGQVTVSPEEQQAASGFPCPVQSTDGRPCQRPYGHELLTQANPEPKPHVYATADPSQLGQPQPTAVTDPLPWTPNPAQSPGGYIPGDAVTALEPTFPQGFQPSGQLSFQVPPTPDAAPHPETNLQPPAPAAPSWSAPV